MLSQKGDGFFVEGDKLLATEPTSFVGNYTVGKIAARSENRQPCINGGTMDGDVWSVAECL